MSSGVSPMTAVWARGCGSSSVPARRRAISGSSVRSSLSDPNAPCPCGKNSPMPAHVSLRRAIGSRLPVRSASRASSRADSPSSSSRIPGATVWVSLRSRSACACTQASRSAGSLSSIVHASTPAARSTSRAICRSVFPAVWTRSAPASSMPKTSASASWKASLCASAARRSSVPSTSKSRSTAQRSKDVPGPRPWANAAMSLAALCTSSSWTSSTGECMYRSGTETTPVGTPARERWIASASVPV